MRKFLLFLFGVTCSFYFTNCTDPGAIGGTVASQVSGTFMSSTATVIINNQMVSDSTSEYLLRLAEVDANTVSVLTPDIPAFEVDLEKSENGEWTTGKTNAAASGFTFQYFAPDATLEIIYDDDGTSIHFEGTKE